MSNDLTQAEIIGLIRAAGWSPTSLSRHLNCDVSMIYHLAAGRNHSENLMRGISEAINVPLEVIRPSIYLGNGPRKPGRPKHTPPEPTYNNPNIIGQGKN